MVLQIRHPIRRAAAGAFVTLALASSAFSQEGCVTAAAAPVVDTVQELRDYVGSIWHASDSTRLAVKKAELERRTQRMAREYAEYNAQCESLDRREWAATQGGGVFVPERPVLNALFPYNNYRANVDVNVGPNNGGVNPNYYYVPNNPGALFNAPPQGPPNPASVRQAPVQQYVPGQYAPTTQYAPQQLPTAAVANYAPQVNYAPANNVQNAPAQLPTAPVNYAPVQYAPFQYGAVPNANANYAPVNAPSSQFTPATPVGTFAPAVPPVQAAPNGYAPAQYAPSQQVAPGYGLFPQPAPQGDPRGNANVPPNPTNSGAF